MQSHNLTAVPYKHTLVAPLNGDDDSLRKLQKAPNEALKTTGSENAFLRGLPESSLENILHVGEGLSSWALENLGKTPSTSEDARHVPLPQTPFDENSSSHPSLISLPASLSTASRSRDYEVSVNSFSETLTAYEARTRHLLNLLPHLKCVCSKSRHDGAKITTMDYCGNVLRGSKHLQIVFGTGEDTLSERHAEIEKGHDFICTNSLQPEVTTRLILLEDIGSTMINILGATFGLSPEFFEQHLHRSGYRGNKLDDVPPSALTTCSLQKDYVSIEWRRPVERWRQEPITPSQWDELLGLGLSRELEDTKYQLNTTTNILRPEFPMYMDPDGELPEMTASGWEERATACVVELDHLKYVILLLDPLPLLHKNIRGNVRAMKKLREQRASNGESRNKILNLFNDPERQIELVSPFTQMHARTPWTLDYHSLFSQTSKQATVQKLPDGLFGLQSTEEALEKWLLSAAPHEVEGYTNVLGPASMIFRIVHQDTLDLLQLMRLALSEVELASTDNVLQERALHWRYRLDQFRTQLTVLEESLQAFVKFVKADATGEGKQPPPDIEKSPIDYLLLNVLDEIRLHKERITQVYTSLTSKVQISDSHRSIAEAETATRLTELAFLFIPLSLATSIFGMQIIDDSTPASIYIAVAVAFTSAAYLLRFLIYRTTERRSDAVRKVRNDITAYAGLRLGSHIPTAVFINWLFHVWFQRSWRLNILAIIMVAMILVPFPLVWTSDLDTGLQIAISCLLASVPIVLLEVHLLSIYYRKMRHTTLGWSSWEEDREKL